MPRIDYAEEGSENPEATPVYADFKKVFGMVPNIIKLLGHSGPAAQGFGQLFDVYFNKLSLDPKIREIAYLTVAKVNGCSYCVGHHTAMAKAAGLSEAKIAATGEDAPTSTSLDDAEKSVARFAVETTANVKASDEAIQGLKKHYDNEKIAEITFVVAAANFFQRVGKNLGAQLEMQTA